MKPGQIMQALEQEEINAVKERTNKRIPEIHVGDTVKVGVKIIEGGKERVQPYEGTIIAMRNGGINETITVRKIFQGVGVERVFLLHSPRIDSITVIRKGRVRRAKLFYLRDRVGKATRVKQRFDRSLSAMRDE
ncbi:MAG: 50S ribosomal protein L19 [Microcoleaceae cyanobacterium]